MNMKLRIKSTMFWRSLWLSPFSDSLALDCVTILWPQILCLAWAPHWTVGNERLARMMNNGHKSAAPCVIRRVTQLLKLLLGKWMKIRKEHSRG